MRLDVAPGGAALSCRRLSPQRPLSLHRGAGGLRSGPWRPRAGESSPGCSRARRGRRQDARRGDAGGRREGVRRSGALAVPTAAPGPPDRALVPGLFDPVQAHQLAGTRSPVFVRPSSVMLELFNDPLVTGSQRVIGRGTVDCALRYALGSCSMAPAGSDSQSAPSCRRTRCA